MAALTTALWAIMLSLVSVSAVGSSLRGGRLDATGMRLPPPLPLERRPEKRRRLSGELDRFDESMEESLRAQQRLTKLPLDDSPDSFVWQNLSSFPEKREFSSFWIAVCAAIKKNATKTGLPFDTWPVANGSGCEPSDGETDFDSEEAAAKACKGTCGGVHDFGCKRKRFRLCPLGAVEHKSLAGSCLRRRIPGLAGGAPRLPQDASFWKRFCGQWTKEVKFRRLFVGRVCSNAEVLNGAPTEARCAELAAAKSSCSEVFDFELGPPTACRCVPKGSECGAPAPAWGKALNATRNVYLLS